MGTEEVRKTPAASSLIGVLGYGGAAAAIAASSIALGDMSETPVKLGVNLGTVAVLLLVGWMVGSAEDDGFHRLRSVFWFVGLFAWSEVMGVFTGPEGVDLEGKWQTFVVAAGIAALAWPLWLVEKRSLQLIAAFFSLHGALVALVYTEESMPFVGAVPELTWPAVVTLVLGIVAFALGATALLKPRRTALVLGSLAAIWGAMLIDLDLFSMAPKTWPLALALGVAVAVLIGGDLLGERAPAGIGIAFTLLLISILVEQNVDHQGPAIAVLIVGLGMLAATVVLVRSRKAAAMPAAGPPVPPPPLEADV